MKGLKNIFALKTGKFGKQIINALARSDLGNHHAYGNAHSPYAWLPPHKAGFLGDTVKLFIVHVSDCNTKSGGNQQDSKQLVNN
jgi:hypothetical protein